MFLNCLFDFLMFPWLSPHFSIYNFSCRIAFTFLHIIFISKRIPPMFRLTQYFAMLLIYITSVILNECHHLFITLLGFEKGAVKIDTFNRPKTEGFQPDGNYIEDVIWNFCCRSDARLSKKLILPNKEPFILFQQTSYGCQQVQGMMFCRLRNEVAI